MRDNTAIRRIQPISMITLSLPKHKEINILKQENTAYTPSKSSRSSITTNESLPKHLPNIPNIVNIKNNHGKIGYNPQSIQHHIWRVKTSFGSTNRESSTIHLTCRRLGSSVCMSICVHIWPKCTHATTQASTYTYTTQAHLWVHDPQVYIHEYLYTYIM
jgi:hypothetical protein